MGQVFPAVVSSPLAHNTTDKAKLTKRIPTLPLSAVVSSITTPAGAAGADLVAAGAGFVTVPAGNRAFVLSVDVIAHAASAGIDAGNTCLIALTNITTGKTVASKTFDNVVIYPAVNTVATLTLDPDHAELKAGDVLGLTVTQGATADHNGFTMQVSGLIEKV